MKPARNYTPKVGIYALLDPRSNRVMYVGQSIDIDYRFRQHCDINLYDPNLAKKHWLRELYRVNLRPGLVVLERCDRVGLDASERCHIKAFRAAGQAELNIAAGGSSRNSARAATAHLDDWHQAGCRVNQLRTLFRELALDAGNLGCPRAFDDLTRAMGALDKAAERMELVLFRAFPEWEGRTHVFTESAEDINQEVA